jgi:hypothetical protein
MEEDPILEELRKLTEELEAILNRYKEVERS